MDSINRQIAIVKPKKPYVDWINSLPDMDEPCDLEGLNSDCTALLLPHFDDAEESMKYIKKKFRQLFEFELDSWSSDKTTWPKNRNFTLFCKWFKVEFHSEVFDIGRGKVEIEEY